MLRSEVCGHSNCGVFLVAGAAVLRENIIHENGVAAIGVCEDVALTAEDNDLRGNAAGSWDCPRAADGENDPSRGVTVRRSRNLEDCAEDSSAGESSRRPKKLRVIGAMGPAMHKSSSEGQQ